MDHRWGERINVDLPVRLMAHPFAKRDGRLMDLSVSGAYIQTDVSVHQRGRLDIGLLYAPWARHGTALLSAYVARRYREG
jgi:hypothetical protein